MILITIHKNSIHKNGIFELSWLPLARYSGSYSWTCLPARLCLVARSVSICFHYRMLALMLRLDFPVSGGLVEDDHHKRSLEDSVFCHLVAVSVHVTFVYRRRHTFYPCAHGLRGLVPVTPLRIGSLWVHVNVLVSRGEVLICVWGKHSPKRLGVNC